MSDIHPPPGPLAQDRVATPGPSEDLTAACDDAVSTAESSPGMPSHGMGDQYA